MTGRIVQMPAPRQPTGSSHWDERAAAAEAAIVSRHVRPLWGMSGTTLGVVGWPPSQAEQRFVRFNYWWQAHLLDCLVDAERRSPDDARRDRLASVARGIRLRNARRWTNSYFDDMAWLGLALQRVDAAGILTPGTVRAADAVDQLTATLLGAWSANQGGIPWRMRDTFRNVPANGPAAILLARTGHLGRARQTVDWMRAVLTDPETGLVFDGIRADGTLQRELYTYCQGVVIGGLTELAIRRNGGDQDDDHTGASGGALEQQIWNLVSATSQHLAADGVISGRGGGDGGLFAGILARYLALVATDLRPSTEAGRQARVVAADLVRTSADAAWTHRAEVDGLPLFGPDWAAAAVVPLATKSGRRRAGAVPSSEQPERDLSVQLGGWMVLEAVATLTPVEL